MVRLLQVPLPHAPHVQIHEETSLSRARCYFFQRVLLSGPLLLPEQGPLIQATELSSAAVHRLVVVVRKEVWRRNGSPLGCSDGCKPQSWLQATVLIFGAHHVVARQDRRLGRRLPLLLCAALAA